jgi:hypothetical protein
MVQIYMLHRLLLLSPLADPGPVTQIVSAPPPTAGRSARAQRRGATHGAGRAVSPALPALGRIPSKPTTGQPLIDDPCSARHRKLYAPRARASRLTRRGYVVGGACAGIREGAVRGSGWRT